MCTVPRVGSSAPSEAAASNYDIDAAPAYYVSARTTPLRALPQTDARVLETLRIRDGVRVLGEAHARVAALDRTAIRETLEAPERRLSEVASTFIERVILENQRRLCHGDAAED